MPFSNATLAHSLLATSNSVATSNEFDRAFLSLLHEIESYSADLSKATRIRIEKWVEKLAMTGHNSTWKKHRNAYAKLLLHMILNRQLEAPFNTMPPQGSIPSFPVHLRSYTVRGAYDRTGGAAANAWPSSFTGKVTWANKGSTSGSSNYVANTILGSNQHNRGAAQYMAPFVAVHDSGLATAGEAGGRMDLGAAREPASRLFWRDVYQRVADSPIGIGPGIAAGEKSGKIGIASDLSMYDTLSDGCDVVINHIHYKPEPPPPPLHAPPGHVQERKEVPSSQSSLQTAAPHTHAHAHTHSYLDSTVASTGQHAHSSTATATKGKKEEQEQEHLHMVEEREAKRSEYGDAHNPHHTHPVGGSSRNDVHPHASTSASTLSVNAPPRHVVAYANGVTKFHYADDIDGAHYMTDAEQQITEIRRLALLVREQHRKIDSLQGELKAERDSCITRLQKQAEEHVTELRRVLTSTCSKCNRTLAGEDDDDSLDVPLRSRRLAERTRHVRFMHDECDYDNDNDIDSDSDTDAQSGQLSVHRTGQDRGRERGTWAGADEDLHLGADTVHPPPRNADNDKGRDRDRNRHMWRGSGITVGTSTSDDVPATVQILPPDRVTAAWQALIGLANDSLLPVEVLIPPHPDERYTQTSYWTKEHREMGVGEGESGNEAGEGGTGTAPAAAQHKAATILAAPLPLPLRGVLAPAPTPTLLSTAGAFNSGRGSDKASHAFDFLERNLGKQHWQYPNGSVGASFPPPVAATGEGGRGK